MRGGAATGPPPQGLEGGGEGGPRGPKEGGARAVGRVPPAQGAVLGRRSGVLPARGHQPPAALDKRQELLVQAEALDIDADPKAAQARLREIQGQWHEAGRVGRDAGGNLDRRLRAVEERVRSAMDVAWRRTTPSDNPLLTQMREQVAEAEARLARAKAAGDAKRIREAEQALASKRQFLQLAEQTS